MLRKVFVAFFLFLWLNAVSQVPDITFRNIDAWSSVGSTQRMGKSAQDHHGNLWFTSTEGIYRYDNSQIESYTFSPKGNSLSSNQTQEVFVDRYGRVLVGTEYGTIDAYDPLTDKFVPLISAETGMRRIYKIIEDATCHIMIGASQGIFRCRGNIDSFENLLPFPPVDPRGHEVRALLPDRRDPSIVWFGGLSIFGQVNLQTGKYTLIEYPYISQESGRRLLITDLYQAPDLRLYAATWGGAIISYDPVRTRWEQYKAMPDPSMKEDLVILKLEPQGDSLVWFSAAERIGVFHLRSETYSYVEVSEHNPSWLAPAKYYTGLLITPQGNIVTTREKGFSISSSIYSNGHALPYQPVISSVTIDDESPGITQSGYLTDGITVSPQASELVITLAAPGYFNTSPVKYSYFLKGFDKKWSVPSTANIIRYTNLTPGREFNFAFKATVDNKVWNTGIPVIVNKEARLWQIPWFQFSMLAAFSGLAIFIFRARIRSIKRSETIKSAFAEQKADLELKALRAQMNPHFVFNSLNSIKHYILTNNPFKAAEYLTDFATLIRSTMQNSSEKVISLSAELEHLFLYIQLEQMRFRHKFDFNCTVEPDVDADTTVIPPLILQPFVENAIWHGLMHKKEPGFIRIYIKKENAMVVCTIEDNGVGRSKAKLLNSKSATSYKSMGMGITKNRIEIYNKLQKQGITIDLGDRIDQQGEMCGTIVTICIPVGNHLNDNVG